jgi:hypothetical protein
MIAIRQTAPSNWRAAANEAVLLDLARAGLDRPDAGVPGAERIPS